MCENKELIFFNISLLHHKLFFPPKNEALKYTFILYPEFLMFSALFQFIFVFNFIQYKPMEFGDSDHLIFSNWIGWILSLVPIILILTFAIIKILKAPKEMHFREVISSKH